MQQGFSNFVSFATGVVVGAGLEYLLDPDTGKKRRHQYTHALGDYMSDIGDRVRHLGEDAYDRASDSARAARDWTMSAGQSARKHAGGLFHMHDGHDDHANGIGAVLGTALGALGVGALMMYAFDPQSGRRRRAMARDQAVGQWNDTRGYVGRKARYAAGHLKGYAHEARGMLHADQPTDQQLRERVYSQLGHYASETGSIAVDVVNGNVVLRGKAPTAEVDKIVKGIKSVRGVQTVENQLQTG